MNRLFVGTSFEIPIPKRGFLFIHDKVPKLPLAQTFDPSKHSIDPLRNLTHRQARDLADVLYTTTPQGENTLTVRNGRRALAPALHDAKRFDLIETDDDEVQGMKDDLLFLPELRAVLCAEKPIFSFKPHTRIFARIDRAELGEYSALVLGLILINHYPGQIIIPDFGFYGRNAHTNLIRQNRLIAGVRFLAELPLQLRQSVLSIKEKTVAGALHEDAELLAKYAGLSPQTNGFQAYVDVAMAAPSLE
jgi:hypothetical protein